MYYSEFNATFLRYFVYSVLNTLSLIYSTKHDQQCDVYRAECETEHH